MDFSHYVSLTYPFPTNKTKQNKPWEPLVFPLLFRLMAWRPQMLWGSPLYDTVQGILKVVIRLFAFPPSAPHSCYWFLKFDGFYGLHRTVFSEYNVSWIPYLLYNREFEVLSPLRELHHFYFFSRFLFHFPLLGSSASLEPFREPLSLGSLCPLKNWKQQRPLDAGRCHCCIIFIIRCWRLPCPECSGGPTVCSVLEKCHYVSALRVLLVNVARRHLKIKWNR